MKIIKKIIYSVAMAISVIVILYGICRVFKPDLKGLIFVAIGAVAIAIIIAVKKKLDAADYKARQQTNRCKNCGTSMRGAQYRFFYDKRNLSMFIDHEHDLPVAVYAICPKCGLEKVIEFTVHEPSLLDMSKPNYDLEAYIQTEIRKQVEYLLNGS